VHWTARPVHDRVCTTLTARRRGPPRARTVCEANSGPPGPAGGDPARSRRGDLGPSSSDVYCGQCSTGSAQQRCLASPPGTVAHHGPTPTAGRSKQNRIAPVHCRQPVASRAASPRRQRARRGPRSARTYRPYSISGPGGARRCALAEELVWESYENGGYESGTVRR